MAEDFATALGNVLMEYNDKVVRSVLEVIPEVAKEGRKKLKTTSPSREGEYSSGWSIKSEKSVYNIEAILYNRIKPGLPHLLEHGHAKRGGGRVGAIPHIEPVEQWVIEETAKKLEEAISK